MLNEAELKKVVTQHVHELADSIDWTHLTVSERQKYYELWTNDPQIGGTLSRILPSHRIRVYLKDTIMKSYSRKQRPAIVDLLSLMSVSYEHISQTFVKPQAVLCDSNKLYTLVAAKEWKVAIMSAFERGSEVYKLKKNVVFFTEHTTGRFVDKEYRDLIDAAAKRLDVDTQWLV